MSRIDVPRLVRPVPESVDALSASDIAAALSATGPSPFALTEQPPRSDQRQAAVLILLLRHHGRWQVHFIRRAESPRDRYSGQVAFPGGMCEPVDASCIDTALRETEEEIGLPRQWPRVLGRLPVHSSLAGIEITPVVAALDGPCRFRLQPSEVARVFTIPLAWLADPCHYDIVPMRDGRGRSVEYLPFDGERLWGATARIALTLVNQLSWWNRCACSTLRPRKK